MEIIKLDGTQINMNEPICSALGFFDGLHIGHMALVNEVQKVANEKNYKTALMTFDHYPLYVLGRIPEEKMLTTMEDRIEILEKIGIDYLFIIRFTKEVATLPPQDFIQNYLINNHIKHIVCGFDFHFGYKNSGDIELLKSYDDFDTSVIDEVIYEGEKISSTRIRKTLDEGHIENINSLLGREYCIQGKVIKGRSIGHTLGFPTANIDYQSYFLPCRGVYAVKVKIGEAWHIGMCNIGFNPTFKELEKTSLEINIIDFHQNIYDQNVLVVFYHKIRNEKIFKNKEQLIAQLNHDQEEIINYFGNLK